MSTTFEYAPTEAAVTALGQTDTLGVPLGPWAENPPMCVMRTGGRARPRR
ncbi:MAG: hypothetical protein U0U69_02595 [Acidimicrobiia bacterium]